VTSERNPYRLYVTHGWREDDEYLRLFEFLESSRNFYYRNLTRPEANPGGGRDRELAALRAQIDPAEIVIALSAQYPAAAFLLDFQVSYARGMRKPVLLLSTFGRDTPSPATLAAQANELVGWDERALTDAIRRHARHEDPKRWATIDFTPV
jgi:hypothetical protein